MKKVLWIIVILIIIAGGWYWYSSRMQASSAPSTAAGLNGSPNQGNLGGTDTGTVQQPGDGTSISDNLALGVDSSDALGQYLIAYNGMTLYTYAKDTNGVSNCTGTCTTNWTPYTVPAGTTLNEQAQVTGTIDTIARADGTMQVTYNGMPLYFSNKDIASGDTNGQAVGGVWYVVKP